MVVRDLADQLEADRLPRQVLAAVPPRRRARQPALGLELLPARPVLPRVLVDRAFAIRREQRGQRAARVLRERGRDADVVEHAGVVVEAEQQGADELVLAALVPAEPRDDAVGGALVLDLGHHALARRVDQGVGLGDDAVEAGALEAIEPVARDRDVAGDRRDVDGGARAGERALEPVAALDERAAAQVVVVLGEQVPRDERGRRAGGERRHPRRGGVDAEQQRVEVEPAVGDDDDLAVEHAARGQRRAQRGLELGEVATERLLVAALDVDVVAGLEHERAEAVPLGLV